MLEKYWLLNDESYNELQLLLLRRLLSERSNSRRSGSLKRENRTNKGAGRAMLRTMLFSLSCSCSFFVWSGISLVTMPWMHYVELIESMNIRINVLRGKGNAVVRRTMYKLFEICALYATFWNFVIIITGHGDYMKRISKLQETCCEYTFREKLIYKINNNRKRIISVTDGLVRYYGLLIQRIVDCFKFYEYDRYNS